MIMGTMLGKTINPN